MSSSAVIELNTVTLGPRTLTTAVCERLRGDILPARFLPRQKLHIAQMGKGFLVSLAATREALSRFVADGLVQAVDQRGFRVRPVSSGDLRDLTRTRMAIEGLALRRSIGQGDKAWLTAIQVQFALYGQSERYRLLSIPVDPILRDFDVERTKPMIRLKAHTVPLQECPCSI